MILSNLSATSFNRFLEIALFFHIYYYIFLAYRRSLKFTIVYGHMSVNVNMRMKFNNVSSNLLIYSFLLMTIFPYRFLNLKYLKFLYMNYFFKDKARHWVPPLYAMSRKFAGKWKEEESVLTLGPDLLPSAYPTIRRI